MSALLSIMWFVIGIIWSIAGKPFIEVAICFLICGVFLGSGEIYLLRKDLEDLSDVDEDTE